MIEAAEAGTSLFLIDEDTSATNFMIRDELMQRVVADSEEPITPFISRVRELFEQAGISSIIVAGSSGSYFHPADVVIQMKEYLPYDITARQKKRRRPIRRLPRLPPPSISRTFAEFPNLWAAFADRSASKSKFWEKRVSRSTVLSQTCAIWSSWLIRKQLTAPGIYPQLQCPAPDGRPADAGGDRGCPGTQNRQGKGFPPWQTLPTCRQILAGPGAREIFACLNRCRELSFTFF